MKIKSLANWYGSNRILSETAGIQLGNLTWCGVPFCGGCPELPFIKTRGGLAADVHRHLINLARCITNQDLFDQLLERADRTLFHPDELEAAQARCRDRERSLKEEFFQLNNVPATDTADPDWAADYFVCCWMGRGGHMGRREEFGQGLSHRFTSSGGASSVRYRSAVESLLAWRDALKGWEFCVLDFEEFLGRCKDQDGHGLYIDAPWPDAGQEYRYAFTDGQQRLLAKKLASFKCMRIVIRFGDHPLIRSLYPEDKWTWVRQSSRNQQNGECAEALILNGPSYSQASSTPLQEQISP